MRLGRYFIASEIIEMTYRIIARFLLKEVTTPTDTLAACLKQPRSRCLYFRSPTSTIAQICIILVGTNPCRNLSSNRSLRHNSMTVRNLRSHRPAHAQSVG